MTAMTVCSLTAAKDLIRNNDLLLFRRRSLISVIGRGIHTHAAKLIMWNEDPFCVEVREWHGGRAVTLKSQVDKYPGQIDVYETNPNHQWEHYDAKGAARFMRGMAGCDYGYANVLAAAMLHLPFVRLLMTANTDDNAMNTRPPFCSQAVAMADKVGGGVDPVPMLANRLTEPADLARSPFYKYKVTLIPSEV